MKINERDQKIVMEVPLTKTAGKIRMKRRASIFDRGVQFSPVKEKFSSECYAEWQVSYDVLAAAAENSSLSKVTFTNNKGKQKSLFELSEALCHMRRWGFVSKHDIDKLAEQLESLDKNDLIEHYLEHQIKRSAPSKIRIKGLNFACLQIEHAQLTHEFSGSEIIAEIVIKQQQFAAGVQPMLYLCIPVSAMRLRGAPIVGRPARSKECADFVFDADHASIILGTTEIFGMLSESHKTDTIAILRAIQAFVS